MDFQLSPEQQAFQDTVARFAARELADGALARARAEGYPWDVARKMAEAGLMGIAMQEADGGQGGTLMDAVLAAEQITLVCPRSADVLQAGNFGPIRTFAEYASEEQKARYLGKLLSGEWVISIGMTEPEAGSALTDLKTTATQDGDGFRVDGTKVFTTHSPYAQLFLVYLRFGPGVGGIGSVLIERETPGLTFGRPSRFLSGEAWQQLYLQDCHVGPENVLLPAGGFQRQMQGFNAERIGNSTRSLSVGRLAFNIAREHAKTRIQFGRPLAEFQGLQWKFADMAMQLEAAQLLLYRAAVNADRGFPSVYETSLAKAYCNKAGFEAANESLQIMGGMGYSEETLVDYCMRRARGWMIAGGSIEVMKTRIAEGIFERRFSQRPPK